MPALTAQPLAGGAWTAARIGAAAALDGLDELWACTVGDPQIVVAVLDGPVDSRHPCFRGARLAQGAFDHRALHGAALACQHGTQVASLIVGQHGSSAPGIAPGCQVVSLPIFGTEPDGSLRRASQLDLARGLQRALRLGAHVVNISAGEFAPNRAVHPHLERVLADGARAGVLVVAAAGNDGCACPHVPALLPGVLAVGALDRRGQPLPSSNWGPAYETHGLLALGERLVSASCGGGTRLATGSSFAAALVSGVAALLLSLQRQRGRPVDAHAVRQALLDSALGCTPASSTACLRFLRGRLNVRGAVSLVFPGKLAMSDTLDSQPENRTAAALAADATPRSMPGAEGGVQPASGCGCQASAPPALAYALGQLGYDLVNEARLDSLAQRIAGQAGQKTPDRNAPLDPRRLLEYLRQSPWDAAALEWTLNLDGVPIYAVRPSGPFAAETYAELRQFLAAQLTEGVERVSVPGVVQGQATLRLGQVVPILVPERRGLYCWTTGALVDAVAGAVPANATPTAQAEHAQRKAGVRNFLERVYHELRNRGMMPSERALNFAATNAFEIEKVFETALREPEKMELESIAVSRSPVSRPHSDCWDVELYFFFPERQVQTVRKVFRFTVDVSDVVPVTIGAMRSWFTR